MENNYKKIIDAIENALLLTQDWDAGFVYVYKNGTMSEMLTTPLLGEENIFCVVKAQELKPGNEEIVAEIAKNKFEEENEE